MNGEHRFPTAYDTERVIEGLDHPSTVKDIARKHGLTYKQTESALKSLRYQGKVTYRMVGSEVVYLRRV